MNKGTEHCAGIVRWLFAAVLAAAMCAPEPVSAQDAPPAGKPVDQPADRSAPDAQSSPAQEPKPIPPPTQRQKEEPSNEEVKITPRQAEELFHSVDEILEFDSKFTGLPIKHEIKRRLTGRDEVVSFLKQSSEEDTQRLKRSGLVLKKFGLLPRNFDLETFLVSLLREEVAGYYDPKTKTVNLLDWVPMEEQEPVMAHELTHALQDQSVGLKKWMEKGDKDLEKIRRDVTPEDIEYDEMDDAREAVVEGQAQAMMFQYAIAPTGHSITDSPGLVNAMEDETMTGTSSTKVFNEAPIFMKESLTFPYSYGMEFVLKVLQKGGRQQAFEGVLKNPPHTTRQIMQPETYLSGEKIEPIRVPDFKRDFSAYQKFDVGAMGEFDVAVLVEQYAGKELSKEMYPEWRGGYYYAAKSAQNLGTDVSVTAPLGLLYVSRWSSADAASEFAGIYAHSLKQRYNKAVAADDSHADAVPEHADEKPNKISLLKGRHAWTTEEGTVVIEEQGDTVLISESLDAATVGALEKEVFGK